MQKTPMPVIGGIISIVIGGIGLLISIMGGIAASVIISSSYYGFDHRVAPAGAFFVIGFVAYFVINAVAIAGGVFAIERRMWGLALAGSICAFFSGWAWIPGVAAIVLIAISKPEFNHITPIQPPTSST